MATKVKPTAEPNPTETFLRLSRELRGKLDPLLKSAGALVNAGDPISAGVALTNETQEWRRAFETLVSTLSQLESSANVRGHSAAEEHLDQLRIAIAAVGASIHGEGSTIIVNGIVHVEHELNAARAKVNGILQPTLAVNTLAEAIATESSSLASQITPPERFLAQLAIAYQHAVVAAKVEFGKQVMTTDLIPWLLLQRQTARFLSDPQASSFVAYPIPLFRADLFTLLKSSLQDTDEAAFRWSPGSTTKGAVFMLVPSMGRTAHVGRIWFERKEKQ